MQNLTKIEAIAFREDHNIYMAKEVAADKRDEWVDQRVNDMLATDYSPFLPNHVTEAMSEMCWPDACMLGAYLTASANNPTNTSAQIHLADFVVRVCTEYWHKIAVFKAQEEYDNGTW